MALKKKIKKGARVARKFASIFYLIGRVQYIGARMTSKVVPKFIKLGEKAIAIKEKPVVVQID